MKWAVIVAAVSLFAPFVAGAQGDEAALALADKTNEQTASAPNACRGSVEVTGAVAEVSGDGPWLAGGHDSLDLYCDVQFNRRWRAVLADRLDDFWQQGAVNQAINTWKESYLSWSPLHFLILDAGRINVRQGVGAAYNPTDYFRADALRAIVSLDPSSLLVNRLGTVMARSQLLWSDGSFTAIYAPRVSTRPLAAGPLNADLGATNSGNRWSLALTQQIRADWKPQLLLFGAEHQPVQVGLNLTHLIGSAFIGYLEWSGGRSRSDAAAAVAAGAPLASNAVIPGSESGAAFRSRLAAGVTYTSPWRVTFTLEYEYNGAGMTDSEWNALRAGPLPAYYAYRGFVGAQQDPPTQRNLAVLARCQQAFVQNLDLAALTRFDPADHSTLLWTEARYHWRRVDLALQWQRANGPSTADLALPPRQSWQAVLDYFF